MSGLDTITIHDLRDRILAAATDHHRSCARVVQRLLAVPEGERKIAIAFHAIGFEYARQMFDGIRENVWENLERKISTDASLTSKRAQTADVLLELFRLIQAEVLESEVDRTNFHHSHLHGERDEDNIFSFLNDKNCDAIHLLANEDPTEIALISVIWTPNEMMQLIDRCLSTERRRRVILQLSRLDRLPETVLRESAQHFAIKLRQRLIPTVTPKAPPEVDAPLAIEPLINARNPEIDALIASVDLEFENAIQNYLKSSSPEISVVIGQLNESQELREKVENSREFLAKRLPAQYASEKATATSLTPSPKAVTPPPFDPSRHVAHLAK